METTALQVSEVFSSNVSISPLQLVTLSLHGARITHHRQGSLMLAGWEAPADGACWYAGMLL